MLEAQGLRPMLCDTPVPYYDNGVRCGRPTGMGDIVQGEYQMLPSDLVRRDSVVIIRAEGDSMIDAGMDEGDIIIVDRAVDPYNNCKAVCYIDGEYTVKRIEIGDGCARLMPANENNTSYKPIEVTPENNFMIWGVVTWVIKKM